MAALSRIAIDDHRHVERRARTTRVVFSARAIPGQREGDRPRREPPRAARRRRHHHGDQARARVRPRQRGGAEADAVARAARATSSRSTASSASVSRYARLGRAADAGAPTRDRRCSWPRTATSCASTATGGRIAGKVPAGRVLIDGTGRRRGRRRGAARSAPPGRGRPHRAGARDQQADRRASRACPDIITRGLVLEPNGEDLLARRARGSSPTCSSETSVEERTDHGLIREKIRVELRRFFRKRSGRRPLVLPVIMEI